MFNWPSTPVTAAYRSLYDVAVLVAGDADYDPVVEAVREAGPTSAVAVFAVPSNSRELRRAADRWGEIPNDESLRGIRLPAATRSAPGQIE
ncbi:MAG: NYN domain-containing protein [Dehalococcoidia bacterium]|nr:NYN domain-containing protein [Dehalococcoidia bacterium]